jgi:hypothetical protein
VVEVISQVIRSRISPTGKTSKDAVYRWVVLPDGRRYSYDALHKWLRRHFSYGSLGCWGCGSRTKKLQWALRPGGRYAKDISQFIVTCSSCNQRIDAGHIVPTMLGHKFQPAPR